MDLNLVVDSYFEYFLTVFGWVISNNIWGLLIDTGIFALPFLFHIIGAFLKVREQGDDEGNKGKLLVAWLENRLYLSFIILMMCCVPLFNVSFSTLKFDTARMKECKTTVLAPEQTGLGHLKTELNGQSAKLPLWWALTYATSKGLTHGAIAGIPCKPDLRQIRFEVQSTQIKDQFLRQEVSNFVQECFLPARAYFKNFGQVRNLDDAVAQDLSWIGSTILLENPNLYPRIQAKTPNPFFPWDATRDAVKPSGLGGGFPYCNIWWSDGTNGLRARLLGQIEPGTWAKIRSVFQSQQGYEDSILKGLLKMQNIRTGSNVSYASDRAAQNSGYWSFSNLFKAGIAGLGGTVGNAITAPAFDSVKQSLPYIQSLILFAISICMPIIIVFSGYSVKAMMTVTFSWFAVFFLSFWWEIAFWLDTSLYETLYGFTSDKSQLVKIDNVDEFLIEAGGVPQEYLLNIITNVMYLVLPGLWIAFLGWSGWRAGTGVDGALKNSNTNTQDTTQRGQEKTGGKLGL